MISFLFIVLMIASHGVFDIFVKFRMCEAYGNGSKTWYGLVGLLTDTEMK